MRDQRIAEIRRMLNFAESFQATSASNAFKALAALEDDLAAARRENATLREALERIARSPDASSVKSDIARAATGRRGAAAANLATDRPPR